MYIKDGGSVECCHRIAALWRTANVRADYLGLSHAVSPSLLSRAVDKP